MVFKPHAVWEVLARPFLTFDFFDTLDKEAITRLLTTLLAYAVKVAVVVLPDTLSHSVVVLLYLRKLAWEYDVNVFDEFNFRQLPPTKDGH